MSLIDFGRLNLPIDEKNYIRISCSCSAKIEATYRGFAIFANFFDIDLLNALHWIEVYILVINLSLVSVRNAIY